MDKDWIISEIRRTASENGGVALGHRKFHKIVGIKEYAWKGKHWRTWGDALKEAGLLENKFGRVHDREFLLDCLAKLTQNIARFPAQVDLTFARSADKTFPPEKSFRKLGGQSTRIELLRKYAAEHKKYTDILGLLPATKQVEEITKKETITTGKTK